jgi:hypothetical protein
VGLFDNTVGSRVVTADFAYLFKQHKGDADLEGKIKWKKNEILLIRGTYSTINVHVCCRHIGIQPKGYPQKL